MRTAVVVLLMLVAVLASGQTTTFVFHDNTVNYVWDSVNVRSVSKMPFTLRITPLGAATDTLQVAINNDTTGGVVRLQFAGNSSPIELRDITANFIRTRKKELTGTLRRQIAVY